MTALWFALQAFHVVKDAFAYRYRGGGWQEEGDPTALHSTFRSRVAWGIASGLTILTALQSPALAVLAVILGVLECVAVEHSPYQGMGRMPMASNYAQKPHNWVLTGLIDLFPALAPALSWGWPSGTVSEMTGSGTRLLSTKGLRVSIIGMASVGFVRGVITGFPLVAAAFWLAWGHGHYPEGLHPVTGQILPFLAMPIINAIIEPLAYVLGYRTPWGFYSLKPYSTEWAEFYRGAFKSAAVTLCAMLC